MIVSGSVFTISLSIVIIFFGQIGRIWGRDARFAHSFSTVGFGESRIRQAGPRFKKRSRDGTACTVDARHGGPTFFAGVGVGGGGRGRGAARRDVTIVFLG
jgi:hypothetical protein